MIVDVAVDVATRRPPRVDATVYVRLDQPVGGDDGTVAGADRAYTAAVHEAHHTAAYMAMCHPRVVMVVGIRTTAVTDL